MAKTEKGKIQDATRTENTRALNEANRFNTTIASERDPLRDRADQERSNLYTRYNQFADSGGIDSGNIERLRGITGPYTYENAGGNTGGGSNGSGGGGDSGSGGGSGVSIQQAPKPALYESPYAGFSEFANTGGVDSGKLEESAGIWRQMAGKEGGFDSDRLKRLNETISGFNEIGKTGGYDPATLANVRGDIAGLRSIGQSGGFDPAALSRIRGDIGSIRLMSDNMRVSDATRNNINESIGRFKDFATTGGLSAEDMSRMRGLGVFDEFANTGGYSSGDISNIRSRSNSVIPSLFSQNREDLGRLNAIQGGGGGANAAALAKMARGSSQAIADASRDTELGISDRVRSGRQWGSESLSNAEGRLQNLLSSNKLAGNSGIVNASSQLSGMELDALARRAGMVGDAARGEADLESTLTGNRLAGLQASSGQERGLQDSIIANRMRGMGEGAGLEMGIQNQISSDRNNAASGIQKTMADAQGLVQGGRQFGLQGMMGVEQARQQAAEVEAARNAASASARYAADSQSATDRAADDYRNRQLASQNERFIMEQLQGGRLSGMEGLSNLYGQTPGELSLNDRNRLAGLDMTSGQQQQGINTRINAAQLPGVMDRIGQFAGMGAGIAGSFMGIPGGAAGVTGAGQRVNLGFV